jgi:DNA helicase-2/ATP-dependent DNA helicase PcrA
MPKSLDGLNRAQLAAVTHPEGPLIVLGGAGTGKTHVLTRRFAWLAEQGEPADSLLALAFSPSAAQRMRDELEEVVEPPYEELHIGTFAAVCARLLRDEALEAGLDPAFVPVTPADRVALLIDRIAELRLRHHEIRGNPAPLLASFVSRIDRLKEEMITPEELAQYARQLAAEAQEGGDAERARASREVEFAGVYADHDRLLAERGAVDLGDLLLRTFRLLHKQPHVRERVTSRFRHVLVDEYQDMSFAQGMVLSLLCEHGSGVAVAGDDRQAIHRFRGAGEKNLSDFGKAFPHATVIRLKRSQRSRRQILAAAAAVVGDPGARLPAGRQGGEVRFWRCATERAQAQAVAREAERLIAGGVSPDAIAVIVPSMQDDGTMAGAALEERAVPFRLTGAAAFFERAEVRDVLAWLRLLADPGDSGAAVRALSRPPVALHSVDIARLTQLARRRKLDIPSAVVAALDGPQLSPEGRDRAQAFLRLHRAALRAFEDRRPDAFVLRLIERVGVRRQQVFATQADTVERLRNIARIPELATAYMRREPQATPRDFARYLKAVADSGLPAAEAGSPVASPAVRVMTMADAKGLGFDHVFVLGLTAARAAGRDDRAEPEVPDVLLKERLPSGGGREAEIARLLHVAMTRAREGLVLAWPESAGGARSHPSPSLEPARAAVGAEEEPFEEELFGPAEGLHSAFRIMRDELLDTVARVGGRLGEMRLDTAMDVSNAVASFLELVKVAAVIDRSKEGQDLDEAIDEVNQLLAQTATPEQREILAASALDGWLRDAGRDPERRPGVGAAGSEPSLDPFIPRRGEGLMLSASDIETYRICPLKYKFARVFRIPQEPTIHQRFGIVLHQVLERFHQATGGGREELFDLFESSWRRAGFGDSDDELQFRERALDALERYWERLRDDEGEPVWFERSFSFRLGPHLLRGRVDRVDLRPDGSYELIDYKTGKARTEEQLREDVQLSVYQMGARESWRLETAAQSYLYVMTGEKVPVEHSEEQLGRVRATIADIGEGILRQEFQPTPSQEICSFCDYRIICPAAER